MADTPKITAYEHYDMPSSLRPGTQRRDWMDDTREKFAYRCLPLTIANSHGWEVIGDTTFRAVWNGKPEPSGVQFDIKTQGQIMPSSHFGDGIITFTMPYLFRTDENIGLWVSGAPNQVKHGIQPLTGLVETDWSPMNFTMNWKITQPHVPVAFKAGEPVCFFFPLDRTLVDRIEPVIRPLSDNPELAAKNAEWSKSRANFLKQIKVEGSAESQMGWQKDYHKGRFPPQADKATNHYSKIKAKAFKRPE